MFVAKGRVFLEKEFLVKKVNGRTVELDEIGESSVSDQKIETLEVVPGSLLRLNRKIPHVM